MAVPGTTADETTMTCDQEREGADEAPPLDHRYSPQHLVDQIQILIQEPVRSPSEILGVALMVDDLNIARFER